MKAALILVDLQNDFLPGGALAVPRGDEVLELANLLQPFFDLVVATQDWHPANHLSFASQHTNRCTGDVIELDGVPQVMWPDHCVQGTEGAELSQHLNTDSVQAVFRKGQNRRLDSYSGFFDNDGKNATGLGAYLSRHKITDVFVLGLATDYCVKATAIDARKLGFETSLIEDACRGVNSQSSDSDDAINEMQSLGIDRVTSDRWLAQSRDAVKLSKLERIGGGRFVEIVKSGRWEYARRCNASAVVVIVAITADDQYVFIEQYREAVGKRCVEFPAGLVGDNVGDEEETLAVAAARELQEETGFEAARIRFLGSSSTSAGLTDETASVFLAEGLHRPGDGGGVDGELIQVHLIARADAAMWLKNRADEGLDVALSLYASLWMAEQSQS